MPALVKALTGVLPNTAIRQLMQALGNCNQPYASRAAQNFQPPEQIGNVNGVYNGGAWNPAQHPGLLPYAGSGGFVDVPGGGGWQGGDFNGGNTNLNNYGGNSFFFPTNQEFALNNYYGGPTFNVGGNTTFENIVTNNLTAVNINVVNGGPVFGGGPQQDAPLPGGAGGGVPGGGGNGFPGAGGVNPIGLPVGLPVTARQINLRASGNVNVPSEGTLTEDCKVQLTGTRRASVQIEISPMNFLALG